ncbi:hypothetical protein GGI19_000340 [Coemansia pectinata]|uniref:Uncharacterized protein n=1 Tax=Coemansia pectinata TaxID=1052879 RepID=A0A9W8H708_9FUNG|nr:hypothetical protein GGI19_000340 [Coemansia pectinata]
MLKVLSKSQYSADSFPNVRLLTLDFIFDKPYTAVKEDAEMVGSNITAFAEYLWKIVPGITEMKLAGRYFAGQVCKTDKRHFIGVILQLYRILKAKMCDLVHLDCKFTGNPSNRSHMTDACHEHLLRLAPQNAATLQSLFADIGKIKDVYYLFPRSGDKYAKYPCLHTLKFYDQVAASNAKIKGRQQPPLPNADIDRLPVFPDTTPFPGLRRLSVDIDYPFGDDMLFRGNAATLEYLNLKVYSATPNIIRKHAVFTSTSHPNMQLVNIDMALGPRTLRLTSAEEQMQFVLGIAPHVPCTQD